MKRTVELATCPICANKSIVSYMSNCAYYYLCRSCGVELHFPVSFGSKVATPNLDETIEKVKTALAESNFS